MKTQTQHYFGGCPECGDQNGYTNVGRSHWAYCIAHKTMWCIGWNLFSSWQNETEAEQRLAYDTIGLSCFTEVKPMPWRPLLRERLQQWCITLQSIGRHLLRPIGTPRTDSELPF